MAVSCAFREFSVLSTDTVGTNKDVDFGFVPTFIICWTVGRDGAVDAVGALDNKPSIGFATSASSRECITAQIDDNIGTSATDRGTHDAAVIRQLTVAGAASGLLDWGSNLASGIRFTVDEQFGTSTRIMVWGVAGSDITNAAVGTFAEAAGPAPYDVDTNVGFEPDVVFCIPFQLNSVPGLSTVAKFAFGAAVFHRDGSVEQGVCNTVSEDGSGSSDSNRYIINSEAFARIGTTTGAGQAARGTFSQITNGFRASFIEGTATGELYGYLAVKGGNWTLKSFTTINGDTTTALPIRGLGTTARGGIAWHVATAAANAADGETTSASVGFGAWDSTSSRGCTSFLDEDAQNTANCHSAIEHDEIAVALSDTGAVDGRVDISATHPDGADYIADTATAVLYGLTVLVGDQTFAFPFSRRDAAVIPVF